MLQELVGQSVEIRFDGFDGEKVKGKVLRVDDHWIEVATKKNIELFNLAKIRKITPSS